MADEQAQQEQQAQPAADQNPNQLDPAFFDAVNAYLAVSDEQTRKFGVKPATMAMNYAAARHSAHMVAPPNSPAHPVPD